MKRALSLILALAMALAMIPVAALAAGTGTYDDPIIIEDDGNYTATLTEDSGYECYYQFVAPEEGVVYISANSDNESTTYGIEINGEVIPYETTDEITGDAVTVTAVELEAEADDVFDIVVYDEADAEISFYLQFTSAEGTAGNPLIILSYKESTLTVPAGKTLHYYSTGNVNGMVFTLVGSDVEVLYNEQTYTATNGAVTFTCVQASPSTPCTYAITNTGSEDATYTVTFAAPTGTWDNPEEMVLDVETTVVLSAGTQGYFYTWTAEKAGTFTVTVSEDTPNGWYFSLLNKTQSVGGTGYVSDPGVDEETGEAIEVVTSASVELEAGDEALLTVNTYDPEDVYNAPAGTVIFTVTFTLPECDHTLSYADNEDGATHTVTCTTCTETVDAAEQHTYTDGVCVCGAEEPAAEDGVITGSGTATAADDGYVSFEYTPAEDGTLSVELTSTVGHKIGVYLDDESTVGLPSEVNSSKATTGTYPYDLEAGVHYTVKIWGYKSYSYAAATITYTATFTAASGEEDVEKTAYEVDYDNTLALGNNSLTLLETAVTTIYTFEAEEAGYYTFTAPEGVILGFWGANEAALADPASTSNVYENWECTAAGQTAYIGVSGAEGEFVLNVAKTGEYNPIVYTEVTYENKAELSAFELSECMVLGDYVDVSVAHELVLGEDGYYHLDSADGAILLIDLDYNDIVLTDKLESDIPVMILYTEEELEDGTLVKYNIGDAVQAYEAVMSEDGYYPVTEDIILFYNDYATDGQQIWAFYGIEGESAWMYCMRTMTIAHGEYAYADNGDGTHDYACSVCGDIANDNEEHTYTDGACACGMLQPVAMIGETTYTSLADALAAAVSGDTVELVANTTETLVYIAPGVTLDLNACTLEATYVLGLNGSYLTADANSGKLIVAQDNIALSTEGYKNDAGQYILPVWNTDHFVFSLFVVNTDTSANRGLTVDEEAKEIYFQFKHQATGAINKGLLADGCGDNELNVIIRLIWTNDNGTASQDFVYNDGYVGEVASGAKDYTFTLTGYTALNIDLDTLVVQAMIVTDNGATAFGAEWKAAE